MTAARVTAMMHELTLDPARAAGARDLGAAELSAAYGLTAEETRAVLDRRLDVLHDLGVHGVTLMQFARTFGFSIADRWAELNGEPRP